MIRRLGVRRNGESIVVGVSNFALAKAGQRLDFSVGVTGALRVAHSVARLSFTFRAGGRLWRSLIRGGVYKVVGEVWWQGAGCCFVCRLLHVLGSLL